MEILASCSLEDAKKYVGKVVIPCEDKKTPDKVSFNVVVTDGDTGIYKELTGIEKFVTFVGNPASFCPTEYEGKVFNEYSLEDLKAEKVGEVKGITTIVRLPNGYCDMKTLYDLSIRYPFVRFIGGNLLAIEGIKIGRSDNGKEKMSSVFNEMYDSFLEVNLSELSGLQEVIKRNKKKINAVSKEKKPRTVKVKQPPKRVQAFNSLFGDCEVDF